MALYGFQITQFYCTLVLGHKTYKINLMVHYVLCLLRSGAEFREWELIAP